MDYRTAAEGQGLRGSRRPEGGFELDGTARGQELCRSRSARAEPGTLAPGNEGADASETESTDKPTVFLVQNRTWPVRLGRTQEAVVIGHQKAAHSAQELGFLLGQ